MAIYPRLLKWQFVRGLHTTSRSFVSQTEHSNPETKCADHPADGLKEINGQTLLSTLQIAQYYHDIISSSSCGLTYIATETWKLLPSFSKQTSDKQNSQPYEKGSKRSRSLDTHLVCTSLVPIQYRWSSSHTDNNGNTENLNEVGGSSAFVEEEFFPWSSVKPVRVHDDVFHGSIAMSDRDISELRNILNNYNKQDLSNEYNTELSKGFASISHQDKMFVKVKQYSELDELDDVISRETVDVTILPCYSPCTDCDTPVSDVDFRHDVTRTAGSLSAIPNRSNHLEDTLQVQLGISPILFSTDPANNQEQETGGKEADCGKKPTLDQLNKIKEYGIYYIPRFFYERNNHLTCTQDIVFENNYVKKPFKTIGISSYILWMAKVRIWGHLKYANIRVNVRSAHIDEEEGCVIFRWTLAGLPNRKAFMFWKFLPTNFSNTLNVESEYKDGISKVYLRASDGCIYKHKMDRVIEDREKVADIKTNPVMAKLALIVGLPAGTGAGISDILHHTFVKKLGLSPR